MKKLKFFSSLSVFAVSCIFLGLGWIEESTWQQMAIICLGIFSGTHTVTDVTAILKQKERQ